MNLLTYLAQCLLFTLTIHKARKLHQSLTVHSENARNPYSEMFIQSSHSNKKAKFMTFDDY